MGKLTIQEVSKVLTGKNGLAQRDAQKFVTEMFNIILQHLEQGEQVKIKGLGTFKIIDVEARESVSVRTGERVVIDSHSKVTFTPDTTMKELVNKPFSQFETVMLNDGVDFEDVEEPSDEESVTEEPVTVEPVVAVPLAVEPVVEEPVVEEPVVAEPVAEEEPIAEEPVVAEKAVAPEPVSETPALEEFVDEEAESQWGRWLLGGLGVLLLMGLSALGGYYYGSQSQPAVADTIVMKDTVFMPEQIDSTDVAEYAEEKPLVEEPKKESAPTIDPYAQKDLRVRYGAYRIVGTSQEVTVRAGQTFMGICRTYLGPGMECYVEAYNDLPQNPKVKEGQIIRIPKLELKKKRRK